MTELPESARERARVILRLPELRAYTAAERAEVLGELRRLAGEESDAVRELLELDETGRRSVRVLLRWIADGDYRSGPLSGSQYSQWPAELIWMVEMALGVQSGTLVGVLQFHGHTVDEL